eukprot:3264180-Prymnesium_polylepis.1
MARGRARHGCCERVEEEESESRAVRVCSCFEMASFSSPPLLEVGEKKISGARASRPPRGARAGDGRQF